MAGIKYLEKKDCLQDASGWEAVFLGSNEGKDYYYRFNGLFRTIIIRNRNDESDCTKWSFEIFQWLIEKEKNLHNKRFLESVLVKAIKFSLNYF